MSLNKYPLSTFVEFSVNFTPFDCAWIPQSFRFIVVGTKPNGTGVMQIYKMERHPDGSLSQNLLSESQTSKAIKCVTFGASELGYRQVACADFEGNLRLFDVEDLTKPTESVRAHRDLINAIDGVGGAGGGEGPRELATASRDGDVKVWDVRTFERPIISIEPKEAAGGGKSGRDAWAVAFGDAHAASSRCLAAGYDNGDLKLVDVRSMEVTWETTLSDGVVSLEFDRRDMAKNKLAGTSLKGDFYIWDLVTKHETKGFSMLKGNLGETSTLWRVAHASNTSRDLFATAAGNGTISLWKYSYPEKRVRKNEDGSVEGVVGTVKCFSENQLGEQPVNSFDWNKEKEGLAVCTALDQKIRIVGVNDLNTV